jgi:tetratricopeptide (TPR) repeat protein
MLPCYKGLNPYDLPEEFVHLQAYNIDTNTFMLDLTKTIKNSVQKKQEYSKKDYSQSDIASAMTNETAAASLKRADIFLSNHDFENALAYYSKCLDTNPECSLAYWGQLAVKLKCITDDDMIALGKPVFDFVEYKNAIRFAAENEKTKYSRVTEGIQQKITDTISQLKAHELFEVRQTNIETELSNCETSIIADEEFINEKLDELLKIEQQLKVVAEECINLVSAEKNSIAEMSIEIQHKLDSHKSEIPTLDKDQTSRWIAQSQQMIKTQYEKFCHTKDVSPEFKEYQELRARQNQLNNVLNTAVQKVQRYNQSLFSTCQKVQKINSIYSEVYTEVKKGVYTNANTLLEKSIT